MVTLSLHSVAQNKQITHTEAANAAINWIENRFNANDVQVININVSDGQYGILLFEIETSLKKTVLLSGSRSCLPVLGIYEGSHLNDPNLPCGLRFMLDYYQERIDSSFANTTCPLYYSGMWDSLIRGIVQPTPKGTPIAPLITSNWRQKLANDCDTVNAYNFLIEPGNTCSHCLAGCVAVAMGQVLYYWKHPVLDYSLLQQYDWCNMTNNLMYYDNPDYETNRDAIAYLLERCGYFVDMEYGCDGSSASTCDAADVLIDRFGFHKHTDCKRRFWHCESWWKDHVIYDLSVGRPVIYGGRNDSDEGHSFICDGYDGDNLFHFNWGWHQSYNNPGNMYTLDNPYPPDDDNYHNYQKAIFYARPNHDEDVCNFDLDLGDFYSNNPFVQLSQMFNNPLPVPLYDLVPQTMTTLTSASATSDASWRTIPANATAVYQAHEEINLQDGFEAVYGSEFEARIEPCAMCDEAGNNMQGANLPEGMASVGDQPDTTGGTVAYAVGQPQELPADALFPNPTDGPLTMSTDGMAQAVLVYTLSGNPVGGWRIVALTETSLSLDVSALAHGTYLLSVATPTGTRTAKFIRR